MPGNCCCFGHCRWRGIEVAVGCSADEVKYAVITASIQTLKNDGERSGTQKVII